MIKLAANKRSNTTAPAKDDDWRGLISQEDEDWNADKAAEEAVERAFKIRRDRKDKSTR